MNRMTAPPVSPVMELGTTRGRRLTQRARRGLEAVVTTSSWRWTRPLIGAAILGVLFAWLGSGPFVDGLRATDARTLAMATGIAAVTTAFAAWRWRVVAHGLRAELSMVSAVAACYRAQFLNVSLPGGVLGDIDRGVHHGRELDDVGRGLRAVAWERSAGQVVLAVAVVAALLVGRPFSSDVHFGPALALGLLLSAAAVLVVGLAARRASHADQRGALGRWSRLVAAEARSIAHPTRLACIVVASLAILAGHVATFVLAAETVGVQAPLVKLLPLALLVLLVAAVPFNVAGWGPREGAAAWAFAGAGEDATQGLAVAVAYGAMVFVATLPGAVLLILGRLRWTPLPLASPCRPLHRSRRTARPAADAGEVGPHG